MQALHIAGKAAVKLHHDIQHCIERKHRTRAELLRQFAFSLKQHNGACCKGDHRKLTENQQDNVQDR